MIVKINCKYNDRGAWCTNKNVKRSLFGIGARCCSEFNDKECELLEIKVKKGPFPKSIQQNIRNWRNR